MVITPSRRGGSKTRPGRSGTAAEIEVTLGEIWAALAEVADPELPIVNLVELGIVRAVEWVGDAVRVTITPTFAACPAYEVMGADIEKRLQALGVLQVEVTVRQNPPWTSEWISEGARLKLKAAGLAPPPHHRGNVVQVLLDPVACPHCDSTNTSLRNSFGTTPCRMIYTCNHCKEPFERMKPL